MGDQINNFDDLYHAKYDDYNRIRNILRDQIATAIYEGKL